MRTDRWARRRAIGRTGIRISLGLGRGTGAKIAPWLLLGLALLVPVVVLVVVSAFVGPATDPDDFELPSYSEYYEWAMVPLALFAAVVAPLLICPDRRDGVLALYAARPITPLDYVGGTMGGVPDGLAGRRVAPPGNPLRLERARRTGAWNLPGRQLGRRAPVPPRRLGHRDGADDTRSPSPRSRRVAPTPRSRCSRSFHRLREGGIAEEDFFGTVADVFSLVSIPHGLVDANDWIFGEEVDCPVSSAVTLVWLVLLILVLAAWLVRRTNRLVRG